jgi:anti-anti-sigma factor
MGKVEIENFENGTILNLSGQFTGGNETDVFVEKVDEIEKLHNNYLIINFSGVSYLSSIVIGQIVKMHAKYDQINSKIIFTGFNHTLESVLKMTKVFTLINVAENIEAAKLKLLK